MAAIEISRPASSGLSVGGQIITKTQIAISSLMAWRETHATRALLNKLSDRELADIGIDRIDIEAIQIRRS